MSNNSGFRPYTISVDLLASSTSASSDAGEANMQSNHEHFLQRKEPTVSNLTNYLFRRFINSGLILGLVGAFLITPGQAFGQLTDEDIEALRDRGKREGWTFEVGHNEATKHSIDELCGAKEELLYVEGARWEPFDEAARLMPVKFDWRDSGGVTPIKYQFPCGSCWAHATVAMLESAIKLVDGVEEDLSEQWLVSCNEDGLSCSGGRWAHEYFLNKGDHCGDSGAVLESVFPYTASDSPCECPYPGTRYFIDSWGYIGLEYSQADVNAIKQALLGYGPIGTAVYVDEAHMAYTGGVFNSCVTGPLNHLVTLVGWDDTQGENGVWILRNSFGTDWGEDGYMRIEYGCSMVGYASTFIVYTGPVKIYSEPGCGPVPLSVQFSASTGFEAESWEWEFGDGGLASGPTPTHTFEQPGVYDVTVYIDTEQGVKSGTGEDCVVVHADTIKGVSVSGTPGSQVEVVITANNTMPVRCFKIPVEFSNDFGLRYDSFSTAGCRTDYFQTQTYAHYDAYGGKRVTLKLVSSNDGNVPDLEAGQGAVARLYFTIPDGTPLEQSVDIVLDGYLSYLPEYQSPLAIYTAESAAGQLFVSESCCVRRGDVDHNGQINLLDLRFLVGYVHRDGPAPACPDEGDIDGDGQITGEDISCLSRYLFSRGNPCEIDECR